uniref:Uncharacterized protein n=1 Tax=Oryza brachyantha TaxID=4533 RepID=J3KUY9_ORYBR
APARSRLGTRDVILRPPWHFLPHGLDDLVRSPASPVAVAAAAAVGAGVQDHAHSEDVVDVLRPPAVLHQLLHGAEPALVPALDVDAVDGAAELVVGGERVEELLLGGGDDALAVVFLAAQPLVDVGVGLRVQAPEGEVLQLERQLAGADGVRERRVHLEDLQRGGPLLVLGQDVEVLHGVEPDDELQDDGADVVAREAPLPHRARGLLVGDINPRWRALHPEALFHQTGGAGTELRLDVGHGHRAGVQGLPHYASRDYLGVHLEVGEGGGDKKRTGDGPAASIAAVAEGRKRQLERAEEKPRRRRGRHVLPHPLRQPIEHAKKLRHQPPAAPGRSQPTHRRRRTANLADGPISMVSFIHVDGDHLIATGVRHLIDHQRLATT